MTVHMPVGWRALALAAIAALGTSACFSNKLAVSSREPPVASSLEALVSGLAEDMLSSPLLRQELAAKFSGDLPSVEIPPGAIRNDTTRMLNRSSSLEEPLRAVISASGVFNVIDTEALRKAVEEGHPGADGGIPEIKRLPVADFMLYGHLAEIREFGSAVRSRLVLKLLDRRTARVVWMGQKDTVPHQSRKTSLHDRLEAIASKMVDDMLSDPRLHRRLAMQFPSGVPTLWSPPGALKNETSQPEMEGDSELLLDSIQMMLLHSGVVGILDIPTMGKRNAMEEAWALPVANSGTRPVPQPVEDWLLFGTLFEFRNGADVHLRLDLQVLDKRSGQIVWRDEDELAFRK